MTMSKEELQEDIHAVIRADLQFFHVKRYRDRWLPLFLRV